jgi:hypothetical protein
MAKLIDIWAEIEKGRGFKRNTWTCYYDLNEMRGAVPLADIFNDVWELEPLPKKELKLFQAVYRLTRYQNNKAESVYCIPERLYKNEKDAELNKPSFGYLCEIELVSLKPVDTNSTVFEEVTE